jgi:site-specific recombinase XerD
VLQIKKRGRYWWADGQVNNRRIHQSLKTSSRTVAESLKRDLELQLLSGGRIRKILWSDFAREFEQNKGDLKKRSLALYQRCLKRFEKFVERAGIAELSQITPAEITAYVEDRKADPTDTSNFRGGKERVKSDLRALHAVFAYAIECGYTEKNPVRFKNLATVGGKTMPFDEAQLAAIFADKLFQSKPLIRALVMTFLFTGLRRSDVANLPVSALNGMILTTQKRGKKVALKLHPALAEAIQAHLKTRLKKSSPLVFPNINIYCTLKRLFIRVGIPDGHPHRFRDTFAVRMLDGGGTLYDVANALGITHRTAEEHYTPYVKQLQDRASQLIGNMPVPGVNPPEKVVKFWVPVAPTSPT